MTAIRRLLELNPHGDILVLGSDHKSAASSAARWRGDGLAVRTVRGRKMRTVNGLFDEFAAALQFPYYFGENWAALGECLSDLDWLPIDSGFVIAVTQPGHVLADAGSTALSILVRQVVGAAKTFSRPISLGESWDRPAIPFHVVLQPESADEVAVRERWTAAGASIPRP